VRPKRKCAGSGVGFALALLGLLASGAALAQGESGGTVTGTVLDARTHQPLPDVVVTATSQQLEGEQVASTDGTGAYRIPQLPPASYLLRFEKEHYRLYARGSLDLNADQTLHLNVELLWESAQEEVTVVGDKGPSIDVGSSQTGLTITSRFAENVPIAPAAANNGGIRSFSGLALAAPQVAQDLFGLSIAGATSPENAYLFDGLSFSDTGFGVNNKSGFTGGGGTAGSDFSVEFIDRMDVITGGYMPEYGRTTGGVLSLTSKSGGNEFHGSVFATWTPGFMAQTAAAAAAPGGGTSIIGEAAKLYNAGDIGFTLGGYIIKDKLWFFVGFNPSQYKTEAIRTVSPYSLDPGGNAIIQPNGTVEQTNIPSATKNYYQTQTNYSYLGKLTYLINSDHRVTLSVAGSPDSYTTPYGFPGGNGDYASQSWAGNDNTLDAVLRLNSSFLEKKLLLDITLGWHHQNNNVTGIDGSSFGQGDAAIPAVTQLATLNLNQFGTEPSINNPQVAAVCNNTTPATGGGSFGDNACPVGGYTQGGPTQLIRNVTEDRIQAKAVLTYFLNALGHQTLKAGADVEYISYENKIGYAGEDGYFGVGNATGPPSGQAYLDFRSIGYLSGPDTPVFLPFQDNKPTALLPGAFFQDSWNLFDKVTLNLGVRFDSEYMYNQDGNLALALNNQWAPRLGIVWDPTYQGRSKLYASYAFYYEAVPLDLADRSLIGNEFISAFHINCENPAVTGQRCSNLPANLVGGGGGPNQYWGAIGADKELIDPNIGPQKTDEFQVGAEYLWGYFRLGVNYTHRGLSRLIEDYSNNSAATLVLGNPSLGIASAFTTPARIYNGYTVSVTRPLTDHWQMQASYTFITLNGNIDGLFTASQGQLDPNITAAYDLPQFLINGFGPLAADTQHRIKFYGSYQFIFTPTIGLTIGGAYNGHSGAPISALGGDLLYGGDTVFIIPRGTYGRLPWVHQVDLHATVDIGLGQDMRLQFGADCFNVLGSQEMTAVDQSFVFPASTPVAAIPNGSVTSLQHLTSPNGNPLPTSFVNPNFGHATAFQAPRSFRLLARYSF
jgi:Carboxypeptidase regulatory-like domain/TonB dependent receptor/TonB-dependent Receptor Plug Domain